jgi:hypothetical protein
MPAGKKRKPHGDKSDGREEELRQPKKQRTRAPKTTPSSKKKPDLGKKRWS